MSDICIIGAGATGLLLLLLLQEANIPMSRITIIDPHFDGGDLARRWTAVISNTPWSKTVDSLKLACPSLVIPERFDPTSTTPLAEIAHLLRFLATPILKKLTQIQGRLISANYNSSLNIWKLSLESGQTMETRKLILTQGSEPKGMDLPIPSIPLEIALDASRLKNYVKKDDTVIVFGTMHSGTIVIQNLALMNAKVTAYYNTPKPFYWSRDNHYDGIKADAADIADRITDGSLPVTLVPIQDTAKLIRTSQDADWVVYAMGFTPRKIPLSIDGIPCSSTEYDGENGRLLHAPAWGFGVAYPNRAPDGIHWDVSVASFLDHMKRQIPNIID